MEKGKANLEALGLLKDAKGKVETKKIYPALKTPDVGKKGAEMEVTILDVREWTFENETKILLTLNCPALKATKEGETRNLALNKTNAAVLLNAFGMDYIRWLSRQVTVKVESTLYDDAETLGLRTYPGD